MTARRRLLAATACAVACVLVAPALAGAHAGLVKAIPAPNKILGHPAEEVRLRFTEAVEPDFARISVTDKHGKRVTAGRPLRPAGDPDALAVPMAHMRKGWYLVFWRVISSDGHPVRGAYTFAVGPNAGPPPKFAVPSLAETAATPGLVASRWIALLSMMCGVGLLLFRFVVARPLIRRVEGSSLRAVSAGLAVALTVAIASILVYVNLATDAFAQVPFTHFSTTIPMMRDSAFGRGYLDLALILALLGVAAAIAVRLDRPERERRSIVEIASLGGALAAASAALLVPGLSGHASQFKPRGVGLALDWVHLLAGSLWIGGLVGLTLVAWRAGAHRVAAMIAVVPRFSAVAFGSVLALIASGTVASILRLPTLHSLWQTGYGQALIVKVGLLTATLGLAAVNLLRTKPRLQRSGADPVLGESTTRLLRRLVGGEAFLVLGAILAASVMSSVAPPPQALAVIGSARASVGPGLVDSSVTQAGYQVKFGVTPNRAARPNTFWLKVSKDGHAVPGADVVAKFTMLDMDMGQLSYKFGEKQPALYMHRNLPALIMVGHWGLGFTITPPGEKPFHVLVVDKAAG